MLMQACCAGVVWVGRSAQQGLSLSVLIPYLRSWICRLGPQSLGLFNDRHTDRFYTAQLLLPVWKRTVFGNKKINPFLKKAGYKESRCVKEIK